MMLGPGQPFSPDLTQLGLGQFPYPLAYLAREEVLDDLPSVPNESCRHLFWTIPAILNLEAHGLAH